ncbi:MAG TPA: hopanoid biosynthesis associated glycosyl transferase HpnI, partial [Vicinamibacteria bacterium]|nr:hopanoid biosynthesis associated glycosyl transferase HpnI [Vicinamibacteria bacterium]
LACRFVLQLQVDRVIHRRRHLFWWGPLRDVLSFVIFVASFFGNAVEWHGHHYGVQSAARIVDLDRLEP